MTSVGTRYDSGVGLPEVHEDGDRPRGCQWNRSVCVASPTHFIEWGTHGDNAAELTTSVYCARHYPLELSYYTEFHIRNCDGPVSAHVGKYGEIRF